MIPKTITYKLRRHPRAKSLRIILRGDGGVTVTAPKRLAQWRIEKFVEDKRPWIETTLEKMKRSPRPYSWAGTAAEFKKFKSSALRLATDRLHYFNQFYGFTWKDVSIRNQRSRWGSCSSTGRLSFSYKICFLPPHLADYILVHELCHLGEMNHSPAFWSLVAQTLPEYKSCRAQLRAV